MDFDNFFPQVLNDNVQMSDSSFGEMAGKYITMNIAQPFMEGNGSARRIWLDMLLVDTIGKCVDWSAIEKYDSLFAFRESPVDSAHTYDVISDA
ncbi:MAG: hypothetical protein EOM74_00915 [Methanomicrobia archaeon]|nr:hypothetical protein [Methanomicrobia archaeon]